MANSELEKAQVMFKLARKNNWGNSYDRLEHFKRFQNLKDIIRELSKLRWIIVHKKTNFTGISLNTEHKIEIVNFIEAHMPHLKGIIN